MRALTSRFAPGVFLTLLTSLFGLALLLAAPAHAQTQVQPATRTAGPTDGDLRFPALTGRVVDSAALLTPTAEAALDAKLAQLERDTGDQLVIVTLTSLQGHEIEDYGYRLGRVWGIGQAGASTAGKNNGVLLIVAPAERKVRIEVGYGLEPVLTDALSAQIIQNDILPAFRQEGYARGIAGGVDSIIAQLRLDPTEAQARAEAAAEPASADIPIGPMILVALVFLFIFLGSLRGVGSAGRRRGDGVGQVLTWAALNALSSSSGRSGGGFGGGFGGGGGGGFSGGGGSFGGGGASGGW